MSALEVCIVWFVILIIVIVVSGEIKYRYDKRNATERKKENDESSEKIYYTLSSVFPDKETQDKCMNSINNNDDCNHK